MKKRTRITHAGRDPDKQHGIVNPPVWRASTVLFPDVASLRAATDHPFDGVYYGRFGTPTQFALGDAICALEEAAGCVLVGSGLAAVTSGLLASLSGGDHLLMVDSVYGPTRKFCDGTLKRLGVDTEYYDPCIGEGIRDLLRDNTRAIFMESPGSLTFEVQDVPAICRVAAERDITTLLDNTWATPLHFRGLEHGVDIEIHAATKYISGHADTMLGLLLVNASKLDNLRSTVASLGHCAGSDDCYLALRGLRTLAVRLEQHERTARELIEWLRQQPEVSRILYPADSECPGHEIWKRDFDGATGLFGVVFEACDPDRFNRMIDGLTLFGLGYSWGGYESLVLPTEPARSRTATEWTAAGPCLRIHAGLEDPADLIEDLAAGFARLRGQTD